VRELLELSSNGRLDLGMQMSRVEDGDARSKIDVPLALDVPHLGVRCMVGIDRERVRDAPRDGFLATLVQVGI